MPSKIVLSYRRSDSDVITGRIRDNLANHYGEDAVFMDIDSIPLGFDYRKQMKDALAENKVMIAVIGPKWLGGRGQDARINANNDPVRIELETALQQGTPIIPVLVSGATMPTAADLPQSLQELCYINAGEVDGGRDFRQHMSRVIYGIDQILKTSESPPSKQTSKTEPVSRSGEPPGSSRKWVPLALGAIACLVVTVGAIWTYFLISPYIKSKNPVSSIVQQNPAPKPSPIPPVVQQNPSSATVQAVIPPPTFTSAACSPEKASFYDDFHKADLGWNIKLSDQTNYADGQLVVTPLANKFYAPKYLSLRYENVTICAHIKSPSQVKVADSGVAGGVVFWASDSDNFYVAAIGPEGSYSIFRRIAGTWVTLIPRTKNEQIKSDPNAINEVTVVIVGHFAALFVNNAKLQEFRGQPPRGGGAFGLFAGSEKTVPDEWRFLDIAVMDKGLSKPVVLPPAPSGPTIGSCQATKATDFQDGFQKPDPGWGIRDPATNYVDGQFSLKPDAAGSRTQLYRPLIFKNATVCVTVNSPLAVSNLDGGSAGGLVFWGADYNNFYAAQIFPNGTFYIHRYVEGVWAPVVPRTMSETIKKGTGAVNDLQVVLNSDRGLFYINGSQVSEFRGQAPQVGGAMGLFAQSENEQASDWRFLNFAIVENQ
jgi:TIR domain